MKQYHLRPRGINRVLRTAAPNGGAWLQGRAAYDAKESLDNILKKAAPDGGSYLLAKRVAYIHFALQAAGAFVAALLGTIAFMYILSFAAWLFGWTSTPAILGLVYLILLVPGWLIAGRTLDKVFE